MKPNFAARIGLVILLGAWSLGLTGCAHPMRFRAVDAATREPLAGVSTLWTQARYRRFSHAQQGGPAYLPPSRPDGIIEVGGLNPDMASSFIFSRPGYSIVYGIYGDGVLALGERIIELPGGVPGEFILEGDKTTARFSNGCFLIPMPK